MKQEKLEQLILLEQSGELSAREEDMLKALLDGDEEARRYRADLLRITETALLTPLPQLAGKHNVDTIIAQAGTFMPRGETTLPADEVRQREKPSFFPLWNQALAYAAMAVMLAVGTWFVINHWQGTEQQAVAMQTAVEDPILDDLTLDANLQELAWTIQETRNTWDTIENTEDEDLDSLFYQWSNQEG